MAAGAAGIGALGDTIGAAGTVWASYNSIEEQRMRNADSALGRQHDIYMMTTGAALDDARERTAAAELYERDVGAATRERLAYERAGRNTASLGMFSAADSPLSTFWGTFSKAVVTSDDEDPSGTTPPGGYAPVTGGMDTTVVVVVAVLAVVAAGAVVFWATR